MEIETKNAVITGTMLGYEDHGIMTAFLYLDYGGAGQGFGGYGLDSYDKDMEERIAHKACGHFIKRVLEITKKEKWEDLKGVSIRVKAERGKVHEIGNYLEDIWFNPGKELKK